MVTLSPDRKTKKAFIEDLKKVKRLVYISPVFSPYQGIKE
jgi:hypothetical protein